MLGWLPTTSGQDDTDGQGKAARMMIRQVVDKEGSDKNVRQAG